MLGMLRKVLIIEPDPDSAEEMFLVLHGEDLLPDGDYYEPAIAVCIRGALEKMAAERFGCVIMAAALLEMRIDEAIPLVRTSHRDIPIVVVTDENSLEMESRIRQLDVQYYHIKCYGLDELELAVRNLCDAGQGDKRALGPSGDRYDPVLLKPLREAGRREGSGQVGGSTDATQSSGEQSVRI